MSNKKKNKKHKNYNNLINYSNFFKECNEFHNMDSETKKYEKCLKLIGDTAKIKVPKEKEKLKYYTNLGELYYYLSKIKSQKCKLSDGKVFDINAILEEKNRQYLEEILKYKELSFENYKKSLDNILIKKSIERIRETNKSLSKADIEEIIYKVCDRNKEQLRIISQDLSNLYYIINEEEKFLLYGKCAVEYRSLNAISIFLKYYCDKLDYENASIYYDLMHKYGSKDYNNGYQNIIIKICSYPIYYNFLYNLGMYEESLNVVQDFKKYIINIELDIKQYEVLKGINKHIEKCKFQIDKSKNIKYTEDILLEYFDKEILKLMSNDNKIYILTSLNIYEYIKSSDITMDYSATLMPILKAIENIMFEIIVENYHTFIIKKDKNKLNKKYINAFLNSNNEIIIKIDRLEYGKALSLIGYRLFENNEIIPNKYFKDFCDENNVINSKDVIIKIFNELDELRNKRNLVAHKNRVYEECVKECYDILLNNIKFINFLYTNFKFIFENKTKD